jgi:hypothetical protein
MIPSVDIQKKDFQTGGTAPAPTGILAIIAASQLSTGTNLPSTYARDNLAVTSYGYGPLSEDASYVIQVAKKPVVLLSPTTSTPGAYSAITATALGGTSAVTADGSQLPCDEFVGVTLTVLTGGTIGTPGIKYTLSKDGGDSNGGIASLGSANFITDAVSGIKLNFASGTLIAGATYVFNTTRPLAGNGDLPASLLALGNTRLPWEGVLIDCTYGTGTVGIVDTWLQGLEARGLFRFALLNTRHKTEPVPAAESEATYAAAMTTLTGEDESIRICVGVDAADYTSTLTGVTQPRPTALFLAARAMLIPVGEDPAFVGRGPLPGASISDGNGNPKWHDEDLYPTLDSQRLTTLRSFDPSAATGVFICNANVLSEPGSDYVWLQHIRTMNLACSIAWQILTKQLSIGVGVQPPDPNTGEVYILEQDAQRIEALVNAAFRNPLNKQVTSCTFALSRTDDLSSNTDSTVTGTVGLDDLRYLKNFEVDASFLK